MATARRGKFGRIPATAPDLTSTIVSLSHQMVAAEDKNITDAWQNGGLYQGKPVTDAMIIAHWQERLQGIDPTDPMYDQYAQTINQLEYNIGLQKAQLAYAQSDGGAAADAKMASFYTTWAKKIPPDSEFYRTLQKSAAQFIQTSRAKGAASAKAAAEANYQAAQAHTIATQENAGAYLTNVVFSILASRGVDIAHPDQTDPAEYAAALASINGTQYGAGAGRPGGVDVGLVLYHDAQTGKAVTVGDVRAQLAKNDPHYTGVVTPAYFHQVILQQQAGQASTLALAKSTGHATDVTNIGKQMTNTTRTAAWIANQPIEQSYVQLRDQWLSTWSDPNTSPGAKMAAWNTYSQGITALANDPKRPPDDVTKARLLGEAQGKTGVEPLATDFTGSAQAGTASNDIALTQGDVQRFTMYQQVVASGAAVWAYGTYDASNGIFNPGAGTEIGATTLPQANAASQAGSVLTYIPQGAGLPMIPVYVAGKQITAQVVDANGNPVASVSPNADVVGTAYDTIVDGVPTRFYAYTDSKTGLPVYTKINPWGGTSVSAHDTGTGVQLTVTLPFAQDAANVKGNPAFSVDAKTGTVYVNPTLAVLSTNPARQLAGPDPNTDSFSPTLALISGTPDGATNIHSMSNDATFQNTLALDALRGSGGVTADGSAAANPTAFQANRDMIGSFLKDPTVLNGAGRVNGGWDVVSTDPTVAIPGGPNRAPGGAWTGPTWTTPFTPQGPGTPASLAAHKLPSDLVRTGQFAALGQVFQPGTSQLVGAKTADSNAPGIVFGHSITVPRVPDELTPAVAPISLPQVAAPSPSPTVNPFTTTQGAAPVAPGAVVQIPHAAAL